MSLYISSLNSGSNGNCYYIGNKKEAVLIDAGLSCRETETRVERLGLTMNRIKAVFISHEHSDHIKGVNVIARKYRIPIYISAGTHKNSRLKISDSLVRYFDAYAPVLVGELSVIAFPKQHDAYEPHSFTVTGNGISVAVLTDLGTACEHVIRNFGQCHAAFLEANYDEEMLENGYYPEYLKTRIRSDKGHLSNMQSLELFRKHKPSYMSHLLLSHLSQDNNNQRLVHDLFTKYAGNTHISIASRHNESEVFQITGETNGAIPTNVAVAIKPPFQMNLFEP